MSAPQVITPRSMLALIDALTSHPAARLVGGGTLEIPRWQVEGSPDTAVYLPGVPELRATGRSGRGAATTLAQLTADPAVPEALRAAAASVGGPALRSTATLGGNIAAASPGCLAVALLALGGEVRLIRAGVTTGWLPLAEAMPGGRLANGSLADGEVAAVTQVRWADGLRAAFRKVTLRMGIAPVLAAVTVSVSPSAGQWLVSGGGTGMAPHLLPHTARLLEAGCQEPGEITRSVSAEVRVAASDPDGGYRRELAATLVLRALASLTEEGAP